MTSLGISRLCAHSPHFCTPAKMPRNTVPTPRPTPFAAYANASALYYTYKIYDAMISLKDQVALTFQQ